MSEMNIMFTTEAMSAVFAPEAYLQRMLDFEAALARAEAAIGVIPLEAAEAIEAACRVKLFDVAALYREAAVAGTLAIPLVRQLTAQVGKDGGQYVHWGATSQDAIDTGLVLQMREGLTLLESDLVGVCEVCAQLAEQHRGTVMAGRTLLQQAVPITFGLKAARWLTLASRQLGALRVCRDQSLALQFGGAAGTLAALGDQGLRVAEQLAAELHLALPDLPWHAERDRIDTIAATLGIASGAMAKIAQDVVLLAQTEVGEASEAAAPGKGGSSAMPQKRNPVDATMALAAARIAVGTLPIILQAMANEHERAVGGWQTEWTAIPALFCHTAGATTRLRSALEGLQIDKERMRTNLNQAGGLLMAESILVALTPYLGRAQAQRLVQTMSSQVIESGAAFRDVVRSNPQTNVTLSRAEINRALDPASYLGSANTLIDRALAAYRQAQPVPDGG